MALDEWDGDEDAPSHKRCSQAVQEDGVEMGKSEAYRLSMILTKMSKMAARSATDLGAIDRIIEETVKVIDKLHGVGKIRAIGSLIDRKSVV